MRRTILLLAALLTLGGLYAQNDARRVLDTMAARVKKAGGVKATFTATSYASGTAQGSASGTFLTDGRRFKMTTSEMTTWFDGKTQWTYTPQTEEVNVATPTATELSTMNPYAFLTIYKKGFGYTMKDATYKGKTVSEVTLTADNRRQDIQRILVTVDKTTHLPLCVRMLQGAKNWVRIAINTFEGGQKYSPATFKFDKKQYPKAEVIDLR